VFQFSVPEKFVKSAKRYKKVIVTKSATGGIPKIEAVILIQTLG